MYITIWSIPKSNWLYSFQLKMEKLYTVSKNEAGHWLWLRSWTPYCKIQGLGKTTRPFRYDLKKILYDYIVEVTNIFKGLDLIQCLKNYGWKSVLLYRSWWPKSSQSGEKMQEGKAVVWEGFTNSLEKKRSERQRRKGKIYPSECRVPKNRKEMWKSLLKWTMKRNRGKQ